MIKNGDDFVENVPKINGRYLKYGDLFNLYCPDIGKPHALICFFQNESLVDVEVLRWVKNINGLPLPRYLSTVDTN